MRRIALLTLALLGLAWAMPKDPPALEIVNRNRFIPADASVDYLVRVQPNAENRRLVFSAMDTEDGNEVRRTEVDLDGDKAERSRWFRWQLPAGDLLLVGQLWGIHGVRFTASQPVCVYNVQRPCGTRDEDQTPEP